MAVPVRRVRRQIVDHFASADATAPDRAIAYDPDASGGLHRLLRRRLFQRMTDFGAVRETRPGRFYLDQVRAAEFATAMRTRALGFAALAAAAGAVAFALGG